MPCADSSALSELSHSLKETFRMPLKKITTLVKRLSFITFIDVLLQTFHWPIWGAPQIYSTSAPVQAPELQIHALYLEYIATRGPELPRSLCPLAATSFHLVCLFVPLPNSRNFQPFVKSICPYPLLRVLPSQCCSGTWFLRKTASVNSWW